MSEWLILIFVLYILYSIMKKSNTTTEKSASKSKVEEPVTMATETKVKNPVSPPKESKKVAAPKAAPKATVIESGKLAPAAVKKATVTKSSTTLKTPAKPKVEAAPKAAKVTSEAPMSERVGLTAGSIWHYLSEKGATSVTELVKEIQEEEKIIQRSIGWLAQEDKITLDTINQVETIALKG